MDFLNSPHTFTSRRYWILNLHAKVFRLHKRDYQNFHALHLAQLSFKKVYTSLWSLDMCCPWHLTFSCLCFTLTNLCTKERKTRQDKYRLNLFISAFSMLQHINILLLSQPFNDLKHFELMHSELGFYHCSKWDLWMFPVHFSSETHYV